MTASRSKGKVPGPQGVGKLYVGGVLLPFSLFHIGSLIWLSISLASGGQQPPTESLKPGKHNRTELSTKVKRALLTLLITA
jgi:hypothetical protein